MATQERTPLPSHAPKCFGCGPDNPCGLGLRAWQDGDEVRGVVTFSEHHTGAPVFAHGGAVATALDDCLGFLMYLIGEPAVTGKLEVTFRKPVTIGTEYKLHAKFDHRDGRKIYNSIDMRDSEDEVVAEATGLFITISIEHFTSTLPDNWREEARKRGIELPW